ncbi:PTS glucose transporter subunit IIA [Pectinatus brassicae]|uniref:Glucose-specific phosphotransferase system IIA component n=1 Tax=Pectinatus brassicae TaxID=862415 RepID=A0A840URT5_9FIRM|nr:PTS glucose transporter subunit IIA [Pectinatus brassicae]MBB5335255.1 glucose-specific phosphotransferase system IIA component [Pectinatus brassicae]
MFGLFKKKLLEVSVPVQGEVIDIDKVQDEVFSSKMMGDGFAVEPQSDCVTAPCDGKIVLLSKTKHAIAIENQGVQLLIHIGLDTVELGGVGFTSYVEQGAQIKKGERLISFDKDYIVEKGKKLTTIVVITNMDEKVKKLEKNLQSDAVLTIEVK